MYLRRTPTSTVGDVEGRTLTVGKSMFQRLCKSTMLVRSAMEIDLYATTHGHCAANFGAEVGPKCRVIHR